MRFPPPLFFLLCSVVEKYTDKKVTIQNSLQSLLRVYPTNNSQPLSTPISSISQLIQMRCLKFSVLMTQESENKITSLK